MNQSGSTSGGFDLRGYIEILKRRKWLLISFSVVALAFAALINWRTTPVYSASTRVELQASTAFSSEVSVLLDSLRGSSTGLQTQVELVKSAAVLRLAATELGLSSPDRLLDQLSVNLLGDTQIVEIEIQHPQPASARDWANAVADNYLKFRRERLLETSLAARDEITRKIVEAEAHLTELDAQVNADPAAASALGDERSNALSQISALQSQLISIPDTQAIQRGGGVVVDPAQTPVSPIRPKKAVNLTIALVIGVLLSLGFIFVAELLDDRVRTPAELEERVGAPVLGYIPFVDSWQKAGASTLVTQDNPSSGTAEAYRTLRTNLRYIALGRPLKTILVASAVAEAGKSTIAANLAVALAQGGSRVIVVSADMRKPTIHKLFNLNNSVGLLDALAKDFPLHQALQESHNLTNLRFLGAGGLPPNPTEILASERFGEILMQLGAVSDFVIIDAPPILGLGEASVLASKVDGVLWVAHAARLNRRELGHAVDQLKKAGGSIVGCVLNAVEPEQGYGYYYRHYYAEYEEVREEPRGKESKPQANGRLNGKAANRKILGGTSKSEDGAESPDESDPVEPAPET